MKKCHQLGYLDLFCAHWEHDFRQNLVGSIYAHMHAIVDIFYAASDYFSARQKRGRIYIAKITHIRLCCLRQ